MQTKQHVLFLMYISPTYALDVCNISVVVHSAH